jgi:hypothetical protein
MPRITTAASATTTDMERTTSDVLGIETVVVGSQTIDGHDHDGRDRTPGGLDRALRRARYARRSFCFTCFGRCSTASLFTAASGCMAERLPVHALHHDVRVERELPAAAPPSTRPPTPRPDRAEHRGR